VKEGDEIVGNETRVKVVKNKVSPPFKQAEFQIMYGKGINLFAELIDLGVKHEFVQKAGAWYSYGDDRIGQGKANSCKFFAENPDKAAELELKIKTKLMPHLNKETETTEKTAKQEKTAKA
jgi:recombination protein RecA